jgi:gliding motility-associated-like protein
MKRLLLIPTLLVQVYAFAQTIDVSTTSHTVPQLVNDVLINSPCVSATNVTWKTGTNFGASNGIGYFQNTNPAFPMQSGVVLSTGNALSAEGPNSTMLSDGNGAWPGDTDLESTLAAAGISMSSVNATILEFDFTPISPNFSFDFIFASEEYGNFQCQFSDAFAFLLTNTVTGVTTNLAVVPNTTQPISVVTIRDFLYNSSCPSANAQYFGSFNGGSEAAGSATNFNGQTVVLNAAANLVPNTPYHIKLVIADRGDYQSDSAIFISSDSFNIGQDVLGPDLTVANNSALCVGESYVLSTNLDPADYVFSWTKDNAPILGENGASITVTEPGVYGVTYNNADGTCEPVTDAVTIQYSASLTAPEPITLYRCNTGAATYTFNLALNTPVVSAGFAVPPTVTYHATLSDANNNVGALPLNYMSAGNETIYVRIQSASSPCSVIKQFQLMTTPGAVANQPPNLEGCARSLLLQNAIFNFSAQTPIVLGGQDPAINIVSYYTSLADAQNNTNAITNLNYVLSGNGTIYVKVQNATDPDCFGITTFTITINPLPVVDELEDVISCEPYVLPPLENGNYFTGLFGTGEPLFPGDVIEETQTIYIFNQPGGPDTCGANSQFFIKIIDPNTISPASGVYCGSYTLPGISEGNYFTQPGGQGPELTAGTVITESQTLYVYYESEEEPFCVIDKDFQVTILPTPQIGTFENVFDCTSYTLPALAVGNYYTQPDGGGEMLPAGTEITSTQTLYVYAAFPGELVCTAEDAFTVVIGVDIPGDVSQCIPYTLPPLAMGHYYTEPNGTGNMIPDGTVISTSQTVYVYVETTDTPNCTANAHFSIHIAQPPVDTLPNVSACESFTLPPLTHGNYFTEPNGSGTPLFAGDVLTTSQPIYIYATSDNNCDNLSVFTVTIHTPPAIDSRSDIDICNSYTLTALGVGNYYTGPGGTGDMLPAGTVITETMPIYIYAISDTTPPCVAENMFTINVFSVEADDPADVTACDSYVLPPLTVGQYYVNSGGPTANEGTVQAGSVITESTTLYIYVEAGDRIICNDENSFTITINETPVLEEQHDVHVCEAYKLPELANGNYFTGPNGTGTMLQDGDVITETQTLYVYAETATSPNCWAQEVFTVEIFKVEEYPDVISCQGYTLPALSIGQYYTGSQGTGQLLPAGSVISASTTVFVFATAPFTPSCTSESSFDVTIVPEPVANAVPAAMTTVCDEDGTNDGVTSFDLTALTPTVLGSQAGPEFLVTYYATLADATAATGAITATIAATAFVRVENNLAPSCFDVRQINIVVHQLPEPMPLDGIICFDTETQTLLNPYTIYSGLGAGYTFQWHDEAGDLVGTGSAYTAVVPGIYTITATRISTGCSSVPVAVNVTPSEPALVSYTITEAFADNQAIAVNAVGTGDYEYMLDNGVWQDSPVFENVSSGVHVVTVRDKNGCGTTTSEALVVNYPHFFTPNGDGYNDTWNIKDLNDQPTAEISIFDRYGKYLKTIRPSGGGWDGNYNGNPLPSTDYWFVVEYEEEGVRREFRAHFAMKR